MGAQGKLAKALLYGKGLRMGALDGFERLIAAIYGTPDRVPIVCQPYTYAMSMQGLSPRQFFTDPRAFVHASYNMANYFGFDFWSPVFDFYNIEAEALGQKLIWRNRSEPDVDSASPLVRDEGDLDKLRAPRPGEDGRMPYVLEAYRRYMGVMGVPPMGYCCSPFTLAVLIRGYVNFLRDMRRRPTFIHRMMEFLSMEVVVPWIDRIGEVTKASVIVMSDAWASQPNMTVQMVREFCLPYVEKVIRATSTSMRTVMDAGSWGERTVKNPREVLDIKMDMMVPGNRFKALRPFFLLVWNEDYEEVGIPLVRSYADEQKVCLALNLRPDLLEQGPPQAVADTVRSVIREGAGKGRFMFLVNLVPVGAAVEHVHTAVAAAKRFGRYPISSDPEGRPFRPPLFVPFDEWAKKEGLPV
jgi:uroporphyrinogen-III decarboxylase